MVARKMGASRACIWGAFLAFGLAPWPACAQNVTTQDWTMSYEVYSGGFHAMAVDLRLVLDPEAYDVTARIRTAGMVSWVYDWNQIVRSTGALGGPRVMPALHRSDGQSRGQHRRAEIVYARGDIASVRIEPSAEDDDDREIVPEAQRRGTLDPISAILVMIRAVSEGRGCNGRESVFDGRRRYDLVFTGEGMRPVAETKYSVFSGPARECSFIFEPVSGYLRRKADPETVRRLNSGRAWLASLANGAPATPVRVELDGNWGMTVAHLRNFRRGAAAVSNSAPN